MSDKLENPGVQRTPGEGDSGNMSFRASAHTGVGISCRMESLHKRRLGKIGEVNTGLGHGFPHPGRGLLLISY